MPSTKPSTKGTKVIETSENESDILADILQRIKTCNVFPPTHFDHDNGCEDDDDSVVSYLENTPFFFIFIIINATRKNQINI